VAPDAGCPVGPPMTSVELARVELSPLPLPPHAASAKETAHSVRLSFNVDRDIFTGAFFMGILLSLVSVELGEC